MCVTTLDNNPEKNHTHYNLHVKDVVPNAHVMDHLGIMLTGDMCVNTDNFT